jgi:hypothetical protein
VLGVVVLVGALYLELIAKVLMWEYVRIMLRIQNHKEVFLFFIVIYVMIF